MTETKLWALGLVAACTLLTATGQLLFKLGLNKLVVVSFFEIITNFQLILGLIFYGFGAILLVIALKYGELSVLYPVVALSFVWVAILSYIFLFETIGLSKIIGILAIIIGVSLIGRGSTHNRTKIKLSKAGVTCDN